MLIIMDNVLQICVPTGFQLSPRMQLCVQNTMDDEAKFSDLIDFRVVRYSHNLKRYPLFWKHKAINVISYDMYFGKRLICVIPLDSEHMVHKSGKNRFDINKWTFCTESGKQVWRSDSDKYNENPSGQISMTNPRVEVTN